MSETGKASKAATSSAVQDSPNGSVAAAILSCGSGSFTLGVLAVAGEASKSLARWLTFCVPTGPLSGVSSLTIIVWLAAWMTLARLWRRKSLSMGRINIISFALLAVGVLLTFPPFADLLLGK